MQTVVPLKYAHAPPWQAPVRPQVELSLDLHFPVRSAPSGTDVHWPTLPTRLHDLQSSVHAELQHTPWAQKPDRHSLAELHWAPLPFLPHEPFTQVAGATHSESWVQLPKQVLPLQV